MPNSFDVLKKMSQDNLDIRLFPDMVDAKTVGATNGTVTMGVNRDTILDLLQNKNLNCVLLVWDKSQFDQVAEELGELG